MGTGIELAISTLVTVECVYTTHQVGLAPFSCRHAKKHDGTTPSDAATLTSEPPFLSFPCDECGKSFMQKNHLASHIYHKHPHARMRKSPSSTSQALSHVDGGSCREGPAAGRVGRASSRVGGACGATAVQVGGTGVKVGVSPVQGSEAPSPGLKSPKELLGFMQSVTSGNQLANLDVGGRNSRDSPFMRRHPSVREDEQEHTSAREVVSLQGGSGKILSAREYPATGEGLPDRGGSGNHHAVAKGSGTSRRSEHGCNRAVHLSYASCSHY